MADKSDRGIDVLLREIEVEVTDPDTMKPVSLTLRRSPRARARRGKLTTGIRVTWCR